MGLDNLGKIDDNDLIPKTQTENLHAEAST